ncbi:MAG: ATP-dependent DNA helicase RecG [Patescibacteria group bacterium]|nr:ATP-dependent DNA helicase RecG [Patescibacteria group bacterium]
MNGLKTKVNKLNRIGKTLEKRLSRLGIVTVEDLLFYFPFRYEDYSEILSIAKLQNGQEVTIRGKIELINAKRSSRQRKIVTEALISDGSDQLRLVWFGQPFISKTLHVGEEFYFSGKVKSDMFGLQMVSPSYERVRNGERGMGNEGHNMHTARIVPMYPLTAGITQKQLRFLVSQVISHIDEIVDWVPEDVRDVADVMELKEAIRSIHFPENQQEIDYALKRLKFDELFILQLRAEMLRQSIKVAKAPKIKFSEKAIQDFVANLSFELTKDQKVSSWEIIQDLGKPTPMNRLLEGDVGSGKTVVAAMATLDTVLNNYQVAIMAPTEVLAKQHYESFCNLLKGHEINVCLLTGSEAISQKSIPPKADLSGSEKSIKSKVAQRKNLLDRINSGEMNVVIGTHALLTDKVKFKNLALVIVDEQHRFGVEQRKTIKEKSGNKKTTPHFLSMTATPIPRSFALTIYGDLDLSIIKQMPSNRKIIKTRLVDDHNRQKAYDFIREQIKQGRQVFVICPLIEQKEKDENEIEIINYNFTGSQEKKSVLVEFEKLSKQIFPDLKVDYLHGKMKSAEKDEIMQDFSSGKIDILVSTSVVEVGVNIPNASVMMIEGAENFGLAQLHQFRGRVGRSSHQSYCFLFTTKNSAKSKERLEFFERTHDGFVLAEYDLEVRGPGAVYGVAQSGMMNLKIATMQDKEIIKLSRDVARGMDFNKYPSLKKKVGEWESKVHLE